MSTADTKDKSGLVATLQCYVDNSKLVGFIMWVIVVAIFQAVARDACATFVLAMEWTNLLLTIFHLISIGLALRVRKACRILWLEARILAGIKLRPNPSPFAGLPSELVLKIFKLACEDCPTTAHRLNFTPLMVSSGYHRALQPRFYSTLTITTQRQLVRLSSLLTAYPSLAKHVNRLTVAADIFDRRTGCMSMPMANPLIIGFFLKHLLVALTEVRQLSLDVHGMAALYRGSYDNYLDCGPRITSLRTELAMVRFLDLPIFEDLEDLEISCFALSAEQARELRSIIPRLKCLTIRLLRYQIEEPPSLLQRLRIFFRWICRDARPINAAAADTEDSDDVEESQTRWSDTYHGRREAWKFEQALEILRAWRPESDAPGSPRKRLESVTILTWADAFREHLTFDAVQGQRVARLPSELAELVEQQRRELDAKGINGLICRPVPALDDKPKNASPQLPSLPPRPLRRFDSPGPRVFGDDGEEILPVRSDVATRDAGTVAASALDPEQMAFWDRPPFINGDQKLSLAEVLLPCPLRVDLNPWRKVGSRKGTIQSWIQAA